MNNPIQNEGEAHELRREILFRPAPEVEVHEETNTPINDRDRMLSIIVLVLACLGLTLLAHVVV